MKKKPMTKILLYCLIALLLSGSFARADILTAKPLSSTKTERFLPLFGGTGKSYRLPHSRSGKDMPTRFLPSGNRVPNTITQVNIQPRPVEDTTVPDKVEKDSAGASPEMEKAQIILAIFAAEE